MRLAVEVCLALPAQQWLVALDLPAGSTVAQAVAAAGLLARLPADLPASAVAVGVWNEVVDDPAQRLLQAGDRVELYRPLQVDPKAARQARARQARLKAASPAP